MSLSHKCRSLPLLLLPRVVPMIMSFSILTPSFLMMWPKNCSFLLTNKPGNCLPSTSCSTSSFVFFAVHDIPSTRLYPMVSNASHRFHSSFLQVQPSAPYVATDHTSAFKRRILVDVVNALPLQIGISFDSPILTFMSAPQSPFAVIMAPR